jgi:hypothetical protein
MKQDQLVSTEERSDITCRLCQRRKEQMLGDACSECVKEILLKHLPLLKRALEDKYGASLDQWLAHGRFSKANWKAETDFQVSQDRLKTFIREIVRESVAKGDITLELPRNVSWKPIQFNQLLDSIYEQCGVQFEYLIGSLLQAISNAPTEEAERELIEIAYGKKRVNKRYLREEAISALVLTDTTPLPLPMKALIEIRYRADGGRHPYTKVMEGEISSVWKEIEASLPEEIVRLIANNNSV